MERMAFDKEQPRVLNSRFGTLVLVNGHKETISDTGSATAEEPVSREAWIYDAVFLETGGQTSEAALVSAAKAYATDKIDAYDTSEAVNGFTLGGKRMWLDKDMRVGLRNSIEIEKNSGKTETTLWYGGEKYVIPIDAALQMLSALELYALGCYNVTAGHKMNVSRLITLEDVLKYDYKSGYPEMLDFKL